MNKGKSRKGFTLVELLAVIVVLAIILVIATVSVNNAVKKTRTEAYIKSAQIIRNEIEAICTMDGVLTEDAIKDAIDLNEIRIGMCKNNAHVHISVLSPNGGNITKLFKISRKSSILDLEMIKDFAKENNYTYTGNMSNEVENGYFEKIYFKAKCKAKYHIDTKTPEVDGSEKSC